MCEASGKFAEICCGACNPAKNAGVAVVRDGLSGVG